MIRAEKFCPDFLFKPSPFLFVSIQNLIMKSVLIAGGTGLIGKHLADRLKKQYRVTILSRSLQSENNGVSYAQWHPERSEIKGVGSMPDVVINLAGAGIADARWTNARKNELIQSRVAPALSLATWLKEKGHTPQLYIGASAIGFYGDRGSEILDEDSTAGNGFLSSCVQAWESAHASVDAHRKVLTRIGIVLSTRGGALPKMMQTVPTLRLLPYFGNGHQMQSWIHIDDLCSIIVACIEDDRYHGSINAVGPAAMSNKDMVSVIRNSLGFFTWTAPVPTFVLKLILGEMSHVVLDSTRVLPAILMKNNFNFTFPELHQAIQDLRSRQV